MAGSAWQAQPYSAQEARGKPMPGHAARGNRTKSRTRAEVGHVFAEQKKRMWLFIRTIGIVRT